MTAVNSLTPIWEEDFYVNPYDKDPQMHTLPSEKDLKALIDTKKRKGTQYLSVHTILEIFAILHQNVSYLTGGTEKLL